MTEEIKKFKLREEKHVTSEVELMAWSPSMDLLALSNINNEVIVNRLSWQRVWLLAPINEGDKVTALSWRPDGKVIAIGHRSGRVRLCDVEKGDTVHFGSVVNPVTFLIWLEQAKSAKDDNNPYAVDNSDNYLPTGLESDLRCDETTPEDSTGLEAIESFKTLPSQKRLNILLVGTDQADIFLFSYGVFPTAVINIDTTNLGNVSVDSATMTSDLTSLFLTLKGEVGNETYTWIKCYDTSLLYTRCLEIRLLAAKFVMIDSSRLELQLVLEQMSSGWEDLLREMDTTFMKFANEKKKTGHGNSMSTDLLNLLLFGNTSLEVQNFLLSQLTDKGLKKLGFSIENSYTTIETLIVRHLLRISQCLTSHLSDLHGMAQWHEKFGILGLNPVEVLVAVKLSGTFAMGGVEIQQVVEGSLKNFKAFFRWLYIAILRLSNKPVPQELNKMSQQEVKFVADFLRDNFIDRFELEEEKDTQNEKSSTEENDSIIMDTSISFTDSPAIPRKSSPVSVTVQPESFSMDRVGQYLKKDDLVQPSTHENNPWVQFLRSSSFSADSEILFESMDGKSMLQRKEILDEAIRNAVLRPAEVIGESIKCCNTLQLFAATEPFYYFYRPTKENTRSPKTCQFTDDKGMLWLVYVTENLPANHLIVVKCPVHTTSEVQVAKVQIGRIGDPFENDDSSLLPDKYVCEHHQVIDFAFFNAQTISLLLREERREDEEEVTLLLQLPLNVVPEQSFVRLDVAKLSSSLNVIPEVDVGSFLSRQAVDYRTVVAAHSLAVGGVRTTASVLMASQRRVRLYLLDDGDADDDDEDEEEEEVEEGEQTTEGVSQSTTVTGSVSVDESSRSQNDEDKENVID